MLSSKVTRRPALLWLAILSTLLILLTACGGGSDEPPPEPTPVTYESYTNEELGFSLEHPQNWVVGTTPDELIEFKSAADVTFDLNYTGGAIVQVMTLPTIAFPDGPLAGLNLLKDDMIASVVESGEEATIVQEPTAVTINGMSAAVTKIEARQGTVDGKAEIYLVSDEELTALLMMFFPRDEEASYRAVFDQILNTFELVATEVGEEQSEEPAVAVDPAPTESESESAPETETAPPAPTGSVAYTSDEFQLSLSYPEGWVIEDTEGYIVIAPDQESLDAPTFVGTGGIIIVGGEFGSIAPEDFLDLAVDPVEFIDDPVLIGSMESIAIQGKPAARMLYEGTMGGDPVEAMFIGVAEGTNAALMVLMYDPLVVDTLGLTLQDIADTVVLLPTAVGTDSETTGTTTAVSPFADGVLYESTEFALSLYHPATWVIEDSEGYIALAPDAESLAAETFTGTGGMVIVSAPLGDLTPEAFLTDFAVPEDFIDNPAILREMESALINGQPAATIIYEGEQEGESVFAQFVAITSNNGSDLAFVVMLIDPSRVDDLGLIMEDIAGTIVLTGEGEAGAGGPGTAVSEETDLPLSEDAYEVLALSADMVTFTSDLSLEEVAEFYRLYAEENGLTEREITTIITDDVINLVFDGWSDTQALIVQAIPFDGATTVTVSVQDV